MINGRKCIITLNILVYYLVSWYLERQFFEHLNQLQLFFNVTNSLALHKLNTSLPC